MAARTTSPVFSALVSCAVTSYVSTPAVILAVSDVGVDKVIDRVCSFRARAAQRHAHLAKACGQRGGHGDGVYSGAFVRGETDRTGPRRHTVVGVVDI